MAEVSTVDRFVTGRADLGATVDLEPQENIGHHGHRGHHGHQRHPEVDWGGPFKSAVCKPRCCLIANVLSPIQPIRR